MNRAFLITLATIPLCLARAADPVVDSVSFSQRPGTKLVDITYTVSDADNDDLTISVEGQDADGAVSMSTLSGDGASGTVKPGTHTLTWDAGADYAGGFDENFQVKLWALDGSSILAYRLTENSYSENDNWTAAAKDEFGPDARVVDWQDLKANFRNKTDLIEMFDNLGIAKGSGGVGVINGGNQIWRGSRAYFFAVHEGDVPGNWLVHDHMFDHYVDLGSWPGERQILVLMSATEAP